MSNQNIDLSCYDEVIGISRTTCECYEENIFNQSKSDLYLDELQGLNLKQLKSLENCEDSDNIWVIMDRARTNSILTCINDITGQLVQKNRLRRPVYTGTIGRKKHIGLRNIHKTYAGVRWFCADIVGGSLKIKKISTLFNQTGTIDLYIYNSDNELVYGAITLNTQANAVKENILANPIELDSHDNYNDFAEYYFVYALPAGFQPYDNDCECLTGCSGFPYIFDVADPYFLTQSNKKKGWADYIMIGAWDGDDLISFDKLETTADSYMNGLLFDVEFGCRLGEVICKDTLNMVNNVMALTLAFMIQIKAGELLLSDIMMHDAIDRYTMMSGEQCNLLVGFYQKKYAEYLAVIMKQIDVKATDCFECKDFITMVKKGLLA